MEHVKCVHNIKSMALLLRFRDDNFPISKEQKIVVKKYITEQYKSIKNIDDIHNLKNNLCNNDSLSSAF